MNQSQTVKSMLRDIGMSIPTLSDDFLDDEEPREKILASFRKLLVVADKPGNVAFQTGLLPVHTFCARTALDLGLFKRIAEADQNQISVHELAIFSGAEDLLIARILRVLAGMHYVQEVGIDAFTSTPITKAFTNPALQAILIHAWDQMTPPLQGTLPYLKANGYKSPTSQEKAPLHYACQTDLSVYDYWATVPGALENFNVAMTGIRASRPIWFDWFPVQEKLLQKTEDDNAGPLLVDIGGGKGQDLVAFRTRFPANKRSLILQDLPSVITSNDKLEGLEQMSYNFFTPQPIHDAKVYFFHFVLHNWADVDARKILRNTIPAMKKGHSRLYINELVLPNIKCPVFPAAMDIFMTAVHTGAERTEQQWRVLLDSEGLVIEKIWHAPDGSEAIIEVTRR